MNSKPCKPYIPQESQVLGEITLPHQMITGHLHIKFKKKSLNREEILSVVLQAEVALSLFKGKYNYFKRSKSLNISDGGAEEVELITCQYFFFMHKFLLFSTRQQDHHLLPAFCLLGNHVPNPLPSPSESKILIRTGITLLSMKRCFSNICCSMNVQF